MGVLHKLKKREKSSGASAAGAGDGKRLKIALGMVVFCLLLIGALCVFTGKDQEVTFRVLAENEIPQQITSQVIPEYRTLERALACVVDGKVYVVATRGEKPTSGYEISIEKMELEEKDGTVNLVVCALFKDPQSGTSLTQAVTYPLQVAETDLKERPDSIELKVHYTE